SLGDAGRDSGREGPRRRPRRGPGSRPRAACARRGRGLGSRAHSGRRRLRIVPKPWGREEIFAENERYAGKLLHLDPGHALSLQYHERKDETLYVLEGEVELEVDEAGQMRTRRLSRGQAYRIRPGTRHRMRADVRCVILEVSSPELDDVVRLED